MSDVRASSLSELAKLGFEALSETVSKLDTLISLLGDNARMSLSPISSAASPDRALDSLIELARAHPKSLQKILKSEHATLRLCKVLGASDALASHLLRHPDQLSVFGQPARLPTAKEIEQISSSSVSELRVDYRKLLLSVADYDLHLDDWGSVKSVTASLSDLAAGAIESGLVIARRELALEGKYYAEEIENTKLSVIAMGKAGARELNYLSDVDVIYVAEGQNENYVEIATRLASRLARILDEPAAEPGLWQLDPNLRPEGKQGALVRSLEAHLAYYQRWAESWEFQALLKARFIAGDPLLGERYIQTIKPLIWSRPDRASIVESARHLRKRVLDLIPASEREREIKLGRGGLRDVEFTAQLMQLVHGTTDESLRVMDTFSALDALAAAGLLSRVDRDVFRRNYEFLRTLEHRVQLVKLRRTHLLPAEESDLRRIARAMGLKPQELEDRWNQARSETAALHDSVFYRPLLKATASLAVDEVQLSDEEIGLRLAAIGFRDPEGASRHIQALTQGVTRRATIQRTLLPVLIRWMAEGTDPDRALLSFRRLSESLGETPWFLGMLRDSSGAAERLMAVLASSALVSRLLEHIPDSCQWFADESSLIPISLSDIETEMASVLERNGKGSAELIRAIRRREFLRVAIGAVLGALSMGQISKALTDISESYLRAMLSMAHLNQFEQVDLCIIAMGRLGGAELGFGSDADAMLLYESSSDSGAETANKIAADLLDLVRDPILHFELDLDLRPEGKNGPRVRTLSGFAGYYEKWAEPWEFQALLRARPISGSSRLASLFIELIDPLRYPTEIDQKALLEVRRIKARVENERLPQGADPARHLKLGRGSLSDVEWVVQLFQLRYAARHPELRTLSTLDALEAMATLNLAEREQVQALSDAWLLSSRARSALVLAADKAIDVLPTDRNLLESVSRILEYPPGHAAELEESYLAVARRSRAAFEKLFVAS